jgi:hypothetical protein
MAETEDIAERLVTLPLFPHMTDDQVDRVAAEILEALAAGGGSRTPAETMRVATHGLPTRSGRVSSRKPTQMTSFPLVTRSLESQVRRFPRQVARAEPGKARRWEVWWRLTGSTRAPSLILR